MGVNVIEGRTVVLQVQLENGVTDRYIRALKVWDDTGEVIASNLNLTHLENGLYKNTSLTMPSRAITAQIRVFSDSGDSSRDTNYPDSIREFGVQPVLASSASQFSPADTVVGVVDSGNGVAWVKNPLEEKQLEIVKGATRTLRLRLIKKSNGEPYDLTGYSAISAQFVKADNTSHEETAAGGGITVEGSEPKLGVILVTLSAADTASLKAGNLQSFEVEITESGGSTRIVQFVRALNVSAQAA